MFAGSRWLAGGNVADEEVTALEFRPPEHGGKCGRTGSLFAPKECSYRWVFCGGVTRLETLH